jgi:hypothetical protein
MSRAIIRQNIVKSDQAMPSLASRLSFGLHALSVYFERPAAKRPPASVARVAKPPTSNAAMFLETYKTAPHSFGYRVRANHELYRQFISPIFGRRHTSSRSFANAASLSASVKPSKPHAPELG